MEKQFVTYEIALKLKELGFDSSCFSAYTENGKLMDIGDYSNDDKVGELDGHSYYISCLSPLWQQCVDWFRKTKNIFIFIDMSRYYDSFAGTYAFQAWCKVYKNKELHNSVTVRNKNDNENFIFYSYELAREQAILKTIELCQKEK